MAAIPGMEDYPIKLGTLRGILGQAAHAGIELEELLRTLKL